MECGYTSKGHVVSNNMNTKFLVLCKPEGSERKLAQRLIVNQTSISIWTRGRSKAFAGSCCTL